MHCVGEIAKDIFFNNGLILQINLLAFTSL